MGSQLQLCNTVGSQLIDKMHKVLVASCLAAAAFADAEPGYLGYGYGYGLGGVSTGVGLHPTGSVYESRSTQGLGKRSAEPGYLGYGLAPYGYAIGGVSTGVGLHSTGSVYESRSAQGLGKRSADAEPGYYTQNYWPSVVTPYGYSTCYGCRGKRSAEPGYLGLGYGHGYGIGGVSRGVGLHPTGSVYESRSAQGLGKRSAEPGYIGYGLAPYGYAIGGVSTDRLLVHDLASDCCLKDFLLGEVHFHIGNGCVIGEPTCVLRHFQIDVALLTPRRSPPC